LDHEKTMKIMIPMNDQDETVTTTISVSEY